MAAIICNKGALMVKLSRHSAKWMPITNPNLSRTLASAISHPNRISSAVLQQKRNCNDYQQRRHNGTKLAEVGKLEPVKLNGNYDTGQMFLHKLFGYRGVVLFPWLARVYDRDMPVQSQSGSNTSTGSTAQTEQGTTSSKSEPSKKSDPTPKSSKPEETIVGSSSFTTPTHPSGKEVKGKTRTYYQVLIDGRDCPFITHRAQTESVTFLGNHSENTRNLYAIPGLDYVAHEDILPYTTTDRTPIQHELFDKFLSYKEGHEPQFVAEPTLGAWQEKNHPWLELSDVHKETTENIRVTVTPFYMGYRENQNNNVYWWRYCIRLENLGEQTVQLRERNWRIFSLSGTLEAVGGRGVVGQEPILSQEQPAFQYSSHVSLQAPSGRMWGTFRMEREDGYAFDCRVPPFSLESKADEPNEPTIIGN